MIRRLIAAGGLTLGAALAAPMAQAHADPEPPNCATNGVGFFKAKQRTICDGPIRPDGSWSRERAIWVPAHQVPLTTNCYGTYSVSCTTTGGYWADLNVLEDQTYVVFPSNVLPDEPDHLPLPPPPPE
ncbi:MAG: hypothetical protein QOJ80_1180 [Mycobacterium sp.]|jgi:hypothetical protein|nr:hypothetical protein [Mycobacterium sp.]